MLSPSWLPCQNAFRPDAEAGRGSSCPIKPLLSSGILQPVAPKHNFLFGHLFYLKTVLDKLPRSSPTTTTLLLRSIESNSKTAVYSLANERCNHTSLLTNHCYSCITNALRYATSIPDLLPRWFKSSTGGPRMF
jgi:hypothetical protein